MCGIAGLVDRRRSCSADELARVATAMSDAVAHRGPDDHGVWIDAAHGVALGHRRLAIVDLSPAGHQPMASADGRVVATFNGEIYNHVELRRGLLAAGVAFRGHSDTEVLCEGIARWGLAATLARANGMFALACWEPGDEVLTLVRDRIGEKPLYWAEVGEHLMFGSELKALRAHPRFRPEIDRDAVAQLLRFGYIPAPATIYRGVRKLEAGTLLRLRPEHAPEVERWWSLDVDRPRRSISIAESADLVEEVLADSVRMRLEADVPVGVFLSGGIDSSIVTALAARVASNVRTFTVGFDDAAADESAAAAAIARHLGTDHTELRLPAADALALVARMPDMYDEPFADPSQLPTSIVAAAARQHVTVALTGDGGDEVFGGYNRYVLAEGARRRAAWVPAGVRVAAGRALGAAPVVALDALSRPSGMRDAGTKLHKLAGLLAASGPEARFASLIEVWPRGSDVVIGAARPSALPWPERGLSELEQGIHLDTVLTLPEEMLVKVDRASMAVALEARPPLLDHRLLELAWTLPESHRVAGGRGKVVLREILARHLPAELIGARKSGFDPPIAGWLRGPLRPWATELLRPERLRAEGWLQPEVVGVAWREHQQRRRNWDYRLWAVLMFQAWLDRWA